MAEAGWYYVEGDPPGSFRRWNGEMWIGTPTYLPDSEGNTQSQVTMAPLPPRGIFGAVLSVAGFGFIGLLLLQFMKERWDERSITGLASNSIQDDSGAMLLVLLGAMLLTSTAFFIWLDTAVRASGALTPNQLRRTGGGANLSWLFWLSVILFGVILTVLFFIQTRESRNNQPHKKRIGLFTMLTMLAERVSRNGERDVGPIKILVWWILLIAGVVGFIPALISTQLSDDAPVQGGAPVFEIYLGSQVISLICIASTVVAITARMLKT